jgi:hypothetical protein
MIVCQSSFGAAGFPWLPKGDCYSEERTPAFVNDATRDANSRVKLNLWYLATNQHLQHRPERGDLKW